MNENSTEIQKLPLKKIHIEIVLCKMSAILFSGGCLNVSLFFGNIAVDVNHIVFGSMGMNHSSLFCSKLCSHNIYNAFLFYAKLYNHCLCTGKFL